MNTYTNTSKISGVVGLVALTVGMKYCTDHSDDIVDVTIKFLTDTKQKIVALLHPRKEETYHYFGFDRRGYLYTSKHPYWIEKLD